MHFDIAMYRVLHEKSNITVSFVEQVIFLKKEDFYSTLGE